MGMSSIKTHCLLVIILQEPWDCNTIPSATSFALHMNDTAPEGKSLFMYFLYTQPLASSYLLIMYSLIISFQNMEPSTLGLVSDICPLIYPPTSTRSKQEQHPKWWLKTHNHASITKPYQNAALMVKCLLRSCKAPSQRPQTFRMNTPSSLTPPTRTSLRAICTHMDSS
jgi:hypothetical protein